MFKFFYFYSNVLEECEKAAKTEISRLQGELAKLKFDHENMLDQKTADYNSLVSKKRELEKQL